MSEMKTMRIMLALAAMLASGCKDLAPNIAAAKRAFPGADAYTPIRVRHYYNNLPGVPIEVRTGDHYFVAVCHEHACTRVESAAVESD